MTRLRYVLTGAALAALFFAGSVQAVTCSVQAPLSAAALNADAPWHYEVFGGTPNSTYVVKVNWPGDPSNGGHVNSSIDTDATGYGITTHLRLWSPDGSLPGYYAFWNPQDPLSGFVAVPGAFSVQIIPYREIDPPSRGRANCQGEVLP